MKANQNILKAANKLLGVWLFLVVLQLLGAAAIWFLVGYYETAFDLSVIALRNIRIAALIFIGVALVIQSCYFGVRIHRTRSLSYTNAVVCQIEDVLVHSYIRDRKQENAVYLLVKEIGTDQKYFSFGKHCLSFYNYSVTAINHTLLDVKIFRKDGSVVSPGDKAKLYIRQQLSVEVSEEKGQLKFNGKIYNLRSVNGNNLNSTLCNAILIEGAVDVEK